MSNRASTRSSSGPSSVSVAHSARPISAEPTRHRGEHRQPPAPPPAADHRHRVARDPEVLAGGDLDRAVLDEVRDRHLAGGDVRERAEAGVDGLPLGAADRRGGEAALGAEVALRVGEELADHRAADGGLVETGRPRLAGVEVAPAQRRGSRCPRPCGCSTSNSPCENSPLWVSPSPPRRGRAAPTPRDASTSVPTGISAASSSVTKVCSPGSRTRTWPSTGSSLTLTPASTSSSPPQPAKTIASAARLAARPDGATPQRIAGRV